MHAGFVLSEWKMRSKEFLGIRKRDHKKEMTKIITPYVSLHFEKRSYADFNGKEAQEVRRSHKVTVSLWRISYQ